MINKRSIWFLTLFSLILVLSVYYITMPSELLLNTSGNYTEENNPTTNINESTVLVALRVEAEEELLKEMENLRIILNSSESSVDEKNEAFEKMKDKLSLPIIVKPANLGSSVGIEIIKDEKEFVPKMQQVFEFCENVLIERCITNLREINCSVVGDFSSQEVSVLEEPIKEDEILSYKDKYLGNGKGGKLSKIDRKSVV